MEENITDKNTLSASRTKTEGNQKENNIYSQKRNNNILKYYYNNLYKLENQALCSGFGKMVNAKNQTNPKYSFGKEKRFFTNEKRDDLPYLHELLEDEKYGNINIGYHHHKRDNDYPNNYNPRNYKLNNSFNSKNNPLSPNKLNTINFVSSSNCATDYYYCPPPTHNYKYPRLPKFSFSKAKRDTEQKIKTYDYYKLSYDKKTDRENIDKKWSTHIIGGDIGVENRFADDRKLYYDSLSPGPGRYNPNYNYFKYKQNKYGYMGIKIKDDKNRVSTDGPKEISFVPYNIKYLVGINNNNNRLNKSLKYKFSYEKDNNIKNKRNIDFRNFFRDKIEQKNIKNNSTFNKNEEFK